ncbi:hypothetical protein [Spongiimicrobium sp. 2-473A-2-J]|uniref:hypothetical protein n=1 Tax=Eudoraea algarum TaxID=3417568 RepID=UPI003D35BFFC
MPLKWALYLLFCLGLLSCSTKKQPSPTEIAQQYYRAMNQSDYEGVTELFLDSIRMIENGYDIVLSKEDYINWLQWDSVFKPTYKILKISEKNGKVQLHVSKSCRRTLFLNGEAVVNNELMTLRDRKIEQVEILNYVVFHDSLWDANRSKLLRWVDENRPELNGFLHDQSKTGGLNYLKAITLYEAHDGKSLKSP